MYFIDVKTEASKINDFVFPRSNARMLRERRNVLIGLTAEMIIFSSGNQQRVAKQSDYLCLMS